MTQIERAAPVFDGQGRRVGGEEAQRRRIEALRLRRTGMSWERIAEAVGYANKGTAYNAVKEELRNASREDVEALRELSAQRLDAYTEILVSILRANHVMVSVTKGQVIIDPDTFEPMKDYKPVIDAVALLVKVDDSQRRLFGVDPKQPVEMRVIHTEVTQADLEFQDMINEEKARRARAKASASGE